jgi:hypothetical protein
MCPSPLYIASVSIQDPIQTAHTGRDHVEFSTPCSLILYFNLSWLFAIVVYIHRSKEWAQRVGDMFRGYSRVES